MVVKVTIHAMFVRQNLEYLNCTPPWLTENEDLWCASGKPSFNISYITLFLSKVLFSAVNPEKCLVPCKTKLFSYYDVMFRCIPTSFQARQLIQQHGLVLSDLETDPRFFDCFEWEQLNHMLYLCLVQD